MPDSDRVPIGANVFKRREIQRRCQRYPGGLYWFAKNVCGFTRLNPRIHLPFCNYIQLTTQPEGPRMRHRPISWMPREHFKSVIVSVAYPLWLLSCVDRNLTIALISAHSDNTKKWLRQIQRIIEHNGLFRFAFPHVRPGEKWDMQEIIITRDQNLSGDAQASITSYSINSGLASQHHHVIILDDPVNEQIAASDQEMAGAVEKYIHLEEILRGWRNSIFVVNGTPWGREDVLHEAQKEERRGFRVKWGLGVLGDFVISDELKTYPELLPDITPGKPILPEECDEEKLEHIKQQDREKYYFQYLPVKKGLRVLMSDFTEKKIEDVGVGDEVVGFVEVKGNGHYRLQKARVEETFHSVAPTVKAVLSNGKELHCTEDHRWMIGPSSYSPLFVGQDLYELDWDRNENSDWIWLRGFLDGEGSLEFSNYIGVSQSERNMHVIDYLESTLARLGINYTMHERKLGAYPILRSYTLKGGRRLRLKLMNGAMGKRSVLVRHMYSGTRPFTSRPTVVSIHPDQDATDVYCLKTSTGNFIVEGIASSNCKPYDEGRNGFDLDLIRDFAELPDGKLLCQCHPLHDHHLRFGETLAVSDPAYTKGKENCETSILIGNQQPCGCRFLLHEFGDHIHPSEYIDKACYMANKFKTWLRGWGVESEALQLTLKQWLEERQRTGDFPLDIEIFPLESKNRSKDARISGAQTPVNNGFWHKPPTMKLVEGQNNTLLQLFHWPYSRQRDRADAFAYFEDAFAERPAGGQPNIPDTLAHENRLREQIDMDLYLSEAMAE